MPLTPGTKVGAYEIVGAIGAGGMGEVYRARDAKLNRDVAIKVLPPIFGSDPDRLTRFEREAQSIAALSHPNILGIHDYGVDGARAYAVMELLEGQTLRERLTDGGLPPRKAIDYAVQMARGLAAAHDKGIIHRDLKPENVIVTNDGVVKILDFGLARQMPAVAAAATAATVQQDTAPGTVMGTVGYMSPEQVRGEPVDARSDLFSLGSVLYEMLTGRRAFQRDTAAETLTAILRDDPPDLAVARTDLPPSLDRIVRHCLEKNRHERFQTARDVAFALESLSGSATSATSAAIAAPTPPRRRGLRAAGALAAAGALLFAGIAVGRRTVAAPHVEPPQFETKTFDPQVIFAARFLPDGQTIVFSAALQGNEPELFVSRPGAAAPQAVGARKTHLLSISSKGELAVLTNATFVSQRLFQGTLARMPLDGTPRPWLENVREADWSPDGTTLAIVRVAGVKDQLEYPIGTKLYETTGYVTDVRVSPDGKSVAFMDHQARYDNRGWVKVVQSDGTIRTLGGEFWGEEGLAWSSDGRNVHFSASEFEGVGYQPHIASAVGEPAAHVILPSIGSVFVLDVRDDRWILVRNDEQLGVRALLPGSSEEKELGWLDASLNPLLSRDGKTLVFADESQAVGANYATLMRRSGDLGVVRLGEGQPMDLSPDGSHVLSVMFTPMQLRLYPTGTGDPIVLNTGSLKTVHRAQFLGGDRRVIACGQEAAGALHCYAVDVTGGNPKPVMPAGMSIRTVAPGGQRAVATMPDGRVVLFDFGDQHTQPVSISGNDEIAGWADDASVFVYSRTIPSRLERVDVVSGQRTLVRELSPADRAGVLRLAGVALTPDARAYAYGYWRRSSRLFLTKHAPR